MAVENFKACSTPTIWAADKPPVLIRQRDWLELPGECRAVSNEQPYVLSKADGHPAFVPAQILA
jgi:hypothetical protein